MSSHDDIYREIQRSNEQSRQRMEKEREHRIYRERLNEDIKRTTEQKRRDVQERKNEWDNIERKALAKNECQPEINSPARNSKSSNSVYSLSEEQRLKNKKEKEWDDWNREIKRAETAERYRRGDFSTGRLGALWPLLFIICFFTRQERRLDYELSDGLGKWRLLTWPCARIVGIWLTVLVYYQLLVRIWPYMFYL